MPVRVCRDDQVLVATVPYSCPCTPANNGGPPFRSPRVYGARARAGESEPLPYFYQNLGEAEYVVATFMFMRLLGYPAHKISILTTYNGQKALIRDVIEQRCAPYPMFGRPYRVRPCVFGMYQQGAGGQWAQKKGCGDCLSTACANQS